MFVKNPFLKLEAEILEDSESLGNIMEKAHF